MLIKLVTHTLQEQAIDMVLTDYCMPEMTGYDLLKAVKVLLHYCCKINHRGIFCMRLRVSHTLQITAKLRRH
jgi:CheY-like chemotaxis protein